MLPASDPLLRPYSPPFGDITNTHGGYVAHTSAQTPLHHLAGRAGSIQLPVPPQFRFVSFGPRYPSGRIPQCDASAASEVVLLVLSAQRCRHPGWGSTSTSAGRPHEMQGAADKSCLFSSELIYTSSNVPGFLGYGHSQLGLQPDARPKRTHRKDEASREAPSAAAGHQVRAPGQAVVPPAASAGKLSVRPPTRADRY